VDTLLRVGLSNALAAAILALLAAGVGWLCHRPALTHGLWLLVLLKLITPPLLPIALFRSDPPVPAADEEMIGPWTELIPESMTQSLPADPLPEDPIQPPLADPPAEKPAEPISWQQPILMLWLLGSVSWWMLAAVRLYRFRRLLRFARPAPVAVAEQARRLAGQLGLSHCPTVWFVPAPLSPMLWALAGSPQLLLPADLWKRLSAGQQDTLLLHELAHLRRRDHWVRGLELLVLGLYWWHPVVWWARRELREAEEQCCDAWVVWASPAAAPAYASALLETVAFLSQARPILPLTASGIGPVHLLRRRLTMIMHGTTPRTLSGAGFLAVLGLAVVLLPLLPTWAQTEPQKAGDDEPQAGQQVNPPEHADDATPAAQADKAQGSTRYGQNAPAAQQGNRAVRPPRTVAQQTRAEQIEKLQDEVELLEVQLEVKRAQMSAGEQSVKRAMQHLDRLQQLSNQGAVSMEVLEKARDEVEAQQVQLLIKRAELKEPEVLLKQARRRLANLQGERRPGGSAANQRETATKRTNPTSQYGRPATESADQLKALLQKLQATDAERQKLAAEISRLQQEVKQGIEQRDQLVVMVKKAEEESAQRKDLLYKLNAQKQQLLMEKARADKFAEAAHVLENQRRDAEDRERKARQIEADRATKAREEFLKTHPDAGRGKPPARDGDQARLADLEKRLDALLREVESLRQDLKTGRTPPPRPKQ
jgi:beta-lactamase regulating signal transducer with metallopeptidase domain